jgi:DNA-binding HxlR family transcriptional regulator
VAKKYLYKGKEYRFGELAKLAKCSKKALESRLKKGWDVEKSY